MSRVRVDLNGKVAFVTGGGSGIGRGFAHQMAQAGAAVVVTDLNGESARAVAGEIAALGGLSLGLPVDVTQPAQLDAAVAETINRFDHLDFVFANAGVLGPAEFMDITMIAHLYES